SSDLPPEGAAMERRPGHRHVSPGGDAVERPGPDAPVGRVALFATCFNDTMWPETLKATVRLLERLGVDVDFPTAQTCCGQMHTNTGYGKDAQIGRAHV